MHCRILSLLWLSRPEMRRHWGSRVVARALGFPRGKEAWPKSANNNRMSKRTSAGASCHFYKAKQSYAASVQRWVSVICDYTPCGKGKKWKVGSGYKLSPALGMFWFSDCGCGHFSPLSVKDKYRSWCVRHCNSTVGLHCLRVSPGYFRPVLCCPGQTLSPFQLVFYSCSLPVKSDI